IYGELAAAMGDSFRETSAGLGTTWPAARGDDDIPALIPPVLRLDYIWHSRQLRTLSTEIGPDLGSDHLPVVAVLALPT
ncbi:MAG: endonuclease/exonuclease/phosphatase, partial [Anaerolineae bacterium]|nr:endonuclease/exonuclease/phosphatase [Anaerolineae bacterium]